MLACVVTGGEKVTPAISGRSSQLLYQLRTDRRGELSSKKKGSSETIPFKFSFSGLTTHFASAYKQVIGSEAPKQGKNTLVRTFSRLWNKVKKKDQFLTAPKSKGWLETEVPVHKNTPANSSTVSEILRCIRQKRGLKTLHKTQLFLQMLRRPESLENHFPA
jgi:hypothetical protein